MQSDGREAKRRRRAESNDTEEGSSIAFQGRRSSAEPQSPREPLHVPPFNAAIEEAKSTSPLLGRTAALYRLLNPSSINTDANYSASAPQNRQFSLPLPLQTQQSLTYRGNTAASASAASATPPPQGNPSTWMETNQQHLQDSSRVPTGIGRSVSSRATATIDKSDKNLWFSQPSGQSIGPDLLGATTIDSQGGMPPLAADLAKFLQNDNSDDTGETTGGSEQEDSKPAARPTTTSNRVSSTTNQSSATPAAAISAFSGEQPYIPQRQSGTLLSSPPRLFAASPAASLAALGEASIQQQPSSPSRTTTRRTRTASAYAAPPASVENAPNSQEARWWDRFRELCDYKDEHGHCQVPLDHTASQHLALARWVKRQRYQYRLVNEGQPSSMTAERMNALNSIGFVWDTQAALWAQRYAELKEFLLTHGHTNVPGTYELNLPLATWVKCQRRQYKLYKRGEESNITAERIAQLDRLGFEWQIRNDYVKADRRQSSSREEEP